MSPNAGDPPVAIDGLSAQEAASRLSQFGPNGPVATKRKSGFSNILHVFMNPLVLILMIAAAASAFLGQTVDAVIIAVIVLMSAAMDISQTYRSQKAIEHLRDQVAPTASVL